MFDRRANLRVIEAKFIQTVLKLSVSADLYRVFYPVFERFFGAGKKLFFLNLAKSPAKQICLFL
jgi:hypothetical protein